VRAPAGSLDLYALVRPVTGVQGRPATFATTWTFVIVREKHGKISTRGLEFRAAAPLTAST